MEGLDLHERVDHSGLSLECPEEACFGPCRRGRTLLRGEVDLRGPCDHHDQKEADRTAFRGFGRLSFGDRGQRSHEANENCQQDTPPLAGVRLCGQRRALEGGVRGEREE